MQIRSYSGRPKSRPSDAALPIEPLTLPPSASVSSEAGRPSPPPRPPTPPSEGRGCTEKSEGVSLVGSRGVSSPPPSRRSVGGEGGWALRGSWLLGVSVTRLLLPSQGLG